MSKNNVDFIQSFFKKILRKSGKDVAKMKQYFQEIGQKLWFNLFAIILGLVLFIIYLLFDRPYLWLGFLFSILIIIPAGYRIWKFKK